jgi:hypothetical protein
VDWLPAAAPPVVGAAVGRGAGLVVVAAAVVAVAAVVEVVGRSGRRAFLDAVASYALGGRTVSGAGAAAAVRS